MAASRTQLRKTIKDAYTLKLMEMLKDSEDILQIKDNEFCFPVVDPEGNEDFIKITVAIPIGAGNGAEPFDGYAEAESYEVTKAQRKLKALNAAEKKEAKIKRDEMYRQKKSEQMLTRHNV